MSFFHIINFKKRVAKIVKESQKSKKTTTVEKFSIIVSKLLELIGHKRYLIKEAKIISLVVTPEVFMSIGTSAKDQKSKNFSFGYSSFKKEEVI